MTKIHVFTGYQLNNCNFDMFNKFKKIKFFTHILKFFTDIMSLKPEIF